MDNALKLLRLGVVLATTVSMWAQGVTPNIGLNTPAYATPLWNVPVNANFTLIDSILGGTTPIPGLTVSGNTIVNNLTVTGNLVAPQIQLGAILYTASGGTSRPLQGKLGDVLSVKDFGAFGNNEHDDTVGIQAALNAAPAGATVWVPTGIYLISNTLNIPVGVSLVGSSGGGEYAFNPIDGETQATVIRVTSSWDLTRAMFTTGRHWASRLEHLTIDGGFRSPVLLALTNNPRGASFTDLLLMDSGAGGGAGIFMQYLSSDPAGAPPAGNVFTRVFAANMQGKALIMTGGTENVFVDCSLTSTSDDAVVINGQSDDNMFYGGEVATQHTGSSSVVLNYPSDSAGGFLNNFYGVAIAPSAGAGGVYANNNENLSFFYGDYMACCGVPYGSAGGGKVKFVDGQQPTASGYASASVLSLGASPYTYTNATPFESDIYLTAGTVSDVSLIRNGVTSTLSASTGGRFTLQPTDQLRITYSVAPSTVIVPK